MKIKANRIAKFRYERGWTQPQLAAMVPTSKTTVHNWETKFYQPDEQKQERLMEIFGATREDLFDYYKFEELEK